MPVLSSVFLLETFIFSCVVRRGNDKMFAQHFYVLPRGYMVAGGVLWISFSVTQALAPEKRATLQTSCPEGTHKSRTTSVCYWLGSSRVLKARLRCSGEDLWVGLKRPLSRCQQAMIQKVEPANSSSWWKWSNVFQSHYIMWLSATWSTAWSKMGSK